ncbi:unnamed protein product [Lymnaea stagnalis]|uniref:Laminin G domain-containing protein n=1 Tax=Lymnaea stagnalis TaxID=6523 RepID=A0AAV2HTQ6_LYMST
MSRICDGHVVLRACCVVLLILIHSKLITAKKTKQPGFDRPTRGDTWEDSLSGCEGCPDFATEKEGTSSHSSIPKTRLNTHLGVFVSKGNNEIMKDISERNKGLLPSKSEKAIRDRSAKRRKMGKLRAVKISHSLNLKKTTSQGKKPDKKVFKGYLPKQLLNSDFEDAKNGDMINDMQSAQEDDGWIWDMLDRDLKVKSPNITRNYEELMLHVHGIFQKFGYSIQKLDSKYQDIFKGTRNGIMLGARHVVENLNKISDAIYGSVLGITNFTRNLFVKAHNKQHENKDQLLAILTEQVIDEKDFGNQLDKSYESQRKLERTLREVQNFKMKSMQGQARLKQVRQLFSENYDQAMIRDYFSYLNVTILSINRCMRKSPPLREIERKMSISVILNEDFGAVGGLLRNSSDILNRALMLFREMQSALIASKLKKINSYELSQNKPWVFRENTGQKLVWKAKSHANNLENRSSSLQRYLARPKAVDVLLLSRNNNSNDFQSLRRVAFDLKRLIKEMYSSLDVIRKYIGGKSTITLPKSCTLELEGSGDDSLEISSDCIKEGSGITEFEDTQKLMPDDEDFSFIDESQHKEAQELPPLRQLTLDVTDYTSRLLKQSQKIYWNSQNLNNWLDTIKSRFSMLQRNGIKPKILMADVAEKSIMFQEIKTKIQQVLHKVEYLKTNKWDDEVKKANDMLENAKKHKLSQEIKPPQRGSKTDFQDTESKLLSSENSIQLLRSMTTKSCGKIRTQLTNMKLNISLLQQKVEKARQIFTSLQIAISKDRQSHIPIPIMQDNTSSLSLTTSLQIHIKPSSLDGMVLLLAGNEFAILGIILDKGEVKVTNSATVVDFGLTPLTVTQWYKLDMLRIGDSFNLTVTSQDGAVQSISKTVEIEELTQPLPRMAYIGGVPETLRVSSQSERKPWEGCVGDLFVNGQALSLFRLDSERRGPELCSNHWIVGKRNTSTVFNGNGFVHYSIPYQERTETVILRFKTKQRTASLMSINNKLWRTFQTVVLSNGTLNIKSTVEDKTMWLSLKYALKGGQDYILKIISGNGRFSFELNGDKAAFSEEKSSLMVPNNLRDGILVGAFISNDHQFTNSSFRPFIGCVQEVNFNDKRLPLSSADEVFSAYLGHCEVSSLNIWQSCWQWIRGSKSLILEEVNDSNRISILVSQDAQGMLLHYSKKDKFRINVLLRKDGITLTSQDKKYAISRPSKYDSWFYAITVTDLGKKVLVKAWNQTEVITYEEGWFTFFRRPDMSQPHTIVVGDQSDERPFTGGATQFVVGNRLHDLSTFSATHKLSHCQKMQEVRLELNHMFTQTCSYA